LLQQCGKKNKDRGGNKVSREVPEEKKNDGGTTDTQHKSPRQNQVTKVTNGDGDSKPPCGGEKNVRGFE